MDSINSFINQIKNSQTIAIFTHINPDGDTLGSATGLKNFITTNFDNKDVTLVVCSEIPEVFGFLPGIKDVVHYSKIDEKPKNFELMKKYATELSKEFKLVRVDFYEIDDKLYLGELTFLPHSGKLKYKNPETDLFFGNMLKLN